MLPRQGTERAGTAYLFLFPFDVFHLADGPPVETVFRQSRVRVYPPFADGGDARLLVRQVELEHVPRLPDTRPPHVAAPRLKNMRAELSFHDGAVRADAMRIDILGPAGPGEAAFFVDRFLELARMMTLQWWITRDRRFDEHYLRNSFQINAAGERLDGMAVMSVVSGRMKNERPLSRALFEQCVRTAAREQRAPVSVLALCDSMYYFTLADFRRFVVEAAVACEIVLVEHATTHAAQLGVNRGTIKRELEKRNFENRLREGCAKVYGRSFATERPEETAWLDALWVARNNVAHGKSLKLRHGGRTYEPSSEEFLAIYRAQIELFQWLAEIYAFRAS